VIAKDLSDDIYVQLEVRKIIVRTNIHHRRFSRCLPSLTAVMFKAHYISLYDAAPWKLNKAGTIRGYEIFLFGSVFPKSGFGSVSVFRKYRGQQWAD
jgi:hypothetical protein